MISRSTLLAGPGFVTAPGAVKFRVPGIIKAVLKWDAQNVTDALKGPFTKVVTDRWLEVDFTPLYYDPTDTTALLFPYLSLVTTPPGTQIFGTSDSAWTFTGNNGLILTLKAGAVIKMPELNVGADKPILGGCQIVGINATGTDPSSSSSFYSITAPGSAPSLPAIPGTATLARQKWTAVYGSDSGWSAFQAFDGFQISHELGLNWIRDNGQRIGALLTGYRAMAKCRPTGNTIAQLASEMAFSGTAGVGGAVVAAQGQRYDANAADLVISGASSGTITVKNATIETGEINFAAEALNQGEVAFISNVGDNSGANVASLVLA